MTKKLTLRFLPFIVLAALFSAVIFVASSGFFLLHQEQLATALTLDFILVIPFVYWLLIRKRNIPQLTVVPVFILGTVLASVYLPKDQQGLLELVRAYAIPVIELGVVSLVVYKVRQSLKRFRAYSQDVPDFFTALRQTALDLAPTRMAGSLLATEIGIFYYGFLNWRRRPLAKNEFSYHKRSGAQALLFVLIMLIGVETVACHLLLYSWKPILAYVLLGLSVYSAVQIWGFARSLSKRPIRLTGETLFLPYGIMGEATIPREAILRVEQHRTSLSKYPEILKLSPLGEMDTHNVVLYFDTPQKVTGLYGQIKETKALAIYVDEAEEFMRNFMG